METIPLEVLAANAQYVDAKCKESKHDVGIVHGLQTTLRFCSELYHNPLEEWRQVRDKVHVSLVARYPQRGNTSVSMGLVSTLDTRSGFVNVINYGTGGIKYQRFHIKDGVISVDKEVKPKQSTPLADVCQGGLETLKQETSQHEIPWDVEEEESVAFVTGMIRKVFYESDQHTRNDLNRKVAYLLPETARPFSKDNNFFMPQHVEGEMEFRAVQAFFKNFEPSSCLPVVSLGIGNGSTQLAYKNTVKGYALGMKSQLDHLLDMATTLANDVVKDLAVICKSTIHKHPTIALKSGCLLLVNKDTEIKRVLIKGLT